MDTRQMHKAVAQGELDGAFAYLYGRRAPEQPQRYLQVLAGVNRRLAALADRVVEVCCGIAIVVKE